MTVNHKAKVKPLVAALSTVFAVNLLAIPAAGAAQNPFIATDLGGGYQLAEHHEGKCGEGKCGADKMKAEGEGKCGEGKCGVAKMDTDSDGTVSRDEFMKKHEEMFTAMDKNSDGVVDAEEMKARHEGKCGEGKCGAEKSE